MLTGLLGVAACAADSGEGAEVDTPPEVSAPAAGSADIVSGRSDDDVVEGPRGNVPLDDFLLDTTVVVGPYAEAGFVAAEGGTAAGAALVVHDRMRGIVLYYRVAEMAPGAYTLRLGRDCGSQGATPLGAIEVGSGGVASGQLLLDVLPSPVAADDQVLMVMSDAGRPVACGPVDLVGGETVESR